MLPTSAPEVGQPGAHEPAVEQLLADAHADTEELGAGADDGSLSGGYAGFDGAVTLR